MAPCDKVKQTLTWNKSWDPSKGGWIIQIWVYEKAMEELRQCDWLSTSWMERIFCISFSKANIVIVLRSLWYLTLNNKHILAKLLSFSDVYLWKRFIFSLHVLHSFIILFQRQQKMSSSYIPYIPLWWYYTNTINVWCPHLNQVSDKKKKKGAALTLCQHNLSNPLIPLVVSEQHWLRALN